MKSEAVKDITNNTPAENNIKNGSKNEINAAYTTNQTSKTTESEEKNGLSKRQRKNRATRKQS